MSPAVRESVLTRANIEREIPDNQRSVDTISGLPADLRGLDLLSALKRRPVGIGPYPHVTWVEAANRVMTDLVLLFGVRWLLTESAFPFSEFRVDFRRSERNLNYNASAHAGSASRLAVVPRLKDFSMVWGLLMWSRLY
jgi:hypothetical protein